MVQPTKELAFTKHVLFDHRPLVLECSRLENKSDT